MRYSIVALVLALSTVSFAEEKKPVGAHLGGFVQLDLFHDSTRSLTEIPGNNPIELDSTPNGANGRTQMSARASRIRINVDGPPAGSWSTAGLLEVDFLAGQPAIPTVTEHNFFSAGFPRIRHMAFMLNKEHWQILVGQYWSLYGILDGYLPTTVAFRPPVGTILARAPQLRITNDIVDDASFKTSLAVALSQPVQRDSGTPNLDFAARFFLKDWQGTWAIPFKPAASQPASLSVSGTLRSVSVPNGISTASSHLGYGFALDSMIPLLPAKDRASPSVVWTAEVSTGQGISEHYPGFTANLPSFAHAAATPTQPNLDAGIGGFKSTGGFELVKLLAANTTLQFHLPAEWKTFFNVYYGIINSSNAASLTPAAGKIQYTQMHSAAANVFHDFAENVRGGLEYMWTKTNYANSQSATNHRLQVSGWFMF